MHVCILILDINFM